MQTDFISFPQQAFLIKKAESQRRLSPPPARALLGSAVQALESIAPTQLSVPVLNPPLPFPVSLLTTGSITPARIDSICQCHSFSSFLMFDLLRGECARTVNSVCFIVILRCSSAITAHDLMGDTMRVHEEKNYLQQHFSLTQKNRTEAARSFTMPAHNIAPSLFLLEALSDLQALFPSRGKSFVKDRSPQELRWI